MTKRPDIEKKYQKSLCESEALHFLLAPPSFGYRECVRRCRVFVVGPGLFVSLSVFVRLFCSFVCSLRRWFVCRLVRSFGVGWLVGLFWASCRVAGSGRHG